MGQGVPQDYAQAAAWYLKAAEQGNAQSQSNLGDLHATGRGVPQDYAQAAAWFLKAAEQGNAFAQYYLGGLYEKGQGVSQDDAQAVVWYQKAAEQGYAHVDLPRCYHKAAEQGDAQAQYELGMCYVTGKGVPQDYAQAAAWFLKAAEQGYAVAQGQLGLCYQMRQGVPQDYAQAAAWYLKAAEQGNAIAQIRLGVLHATSQDYAQAAAWFLKAAEQGDAPAQSQLGFFYANGLGVPQDWAQAAAWHLKAAEQGSVISQCALYNYKQHDPHDLDQAVAWYKKAAEEGHPDAQGNLGCCYYHGDGVPQDYAKAVEWYRKAAVKGVLPACTALGRCYEFGNGVPRDPTESTRWYQKGRGSANMLSLEEEVTLRSTARTVKAIGDVTRFFEAPYPLRTGRAVQAAHGLQDLMAMDSSTLLAACAQGVDAIGAEVARYAETTVEGREVEELLHYILYEPTSEKEYVNGVRDKGRCNVTLDHFLQHPKAQAARLLKEHVVALRLYTTVACKAMNSPLRDDARTEPCPLPVATHYAAEGIKKLRALNAGEKTGPVLWRGNPLRDDARTEGGPLPVATHYEIVNAGEKTGPVLWRGMRSMEATKDFLQNGGTELAFMSTTTMLEVAVRYSLSSRALLFKVVPPSFMALGAELQWLSAFPGEEEILYPPLTYLQTTGRVVDVSVERDDGTVCYTVVEVVPSMA